MSTVCTSCGTEVDEDAIFCPTCGQPIRAAAEPQLPQAPDWPQPPASPIEPMGSDPVVGASSDATAPVGWAEPAPPESRAPANEGVDEPPPPAAPPPDLPPWRRAAGFQRTSVPPPVTPAAGPAFAGTDTPEVPPVQPATPEPAVESEGGWSTVPPPVRPDPLAAFRSTPSPAEGSAPPSPTVELPETLSGWLASAGAFMGILSLFLPWREGFGYTASWGLASGINVIVGIMLLAMLVVLLAPRLLPRIPRRNLWITAIGLVGVGLGLDRLGLPLTGMGANIFLIAMLLIAAGGLLAELGFDRQVGGAQP
jgi:zinc-ribbon domain